MLGVEQIHCIINTKNNVCFFHYYSDSVLTAPEREKNLVDTRFFSPEVCAEAPQTSAGSHHRNRLRDFASGVSAQKRFDMSESVKKAQMRQFIAAVSRVPSCK